MIFNGENQVYFKEIESKHNETQSLCHPATAFPITNTTKATNQKWGLEDVATQQALFFFSLFPSTAQYHVSVACTERDRRVLAAERGKNSRENTNLTSSMEV